MEIKADCRARLMSRWISQDRDALSGMSGEVHIVNKTRTGRVGVRIFTSYGDLLAVWTERVLVSPDGCTIDEADVIDPCSVSGDYVCQAADLDSRDRRWSILRDCILREHQSKKAWKSKGIIGGKAEPEEADKTNGRAGRDAGVWSFGKQTEEEKSRPERNSKRGDRTEPEGSSTDLDYVPRAATFPPSIASEGLL